MTIIYCKKCGTDLKGHEICPNCGTPQIGPDNPRYGSAVVGKKVDKIAYALLAILLGSLGVHRFYAGKIMSGIFYLLFCWTGIPGILGLIEGIIAITRHSDGNGDIPVTNDYFV